MLPLLCKKKMKETKNGLSVFFIRGDFPRCIKQHHHPHNVMQDLPFCFMLANTQQFAPSLLPPCFRGVFEEGRHSTQHQSVHRWEDWGTEIGCIHSLQRKWWRITVIQGCMFYQLSKQWNLFFFWERKLLSENSSSIFPSNSRYLESRVWWGRLYRRLWDI